MSQILLDNGHGIDTPGKRSPDRLFREFAYNSYIASQIHQRMKSNGLDSQLITFLHTFLDPVIIEGLIEQYRIGVSAGTVSREIRRNCDMRGYHRYRWQLAKRSTKGG